MRLVGTEAYQAQPSVDANKVKLNTGGSHLAKAMGVDTNNQLQGYEPPDCNAKNTATYSMKSEIAKYKEHI